ncbi:MAG: YajQ family cyclic di-GMP-binding protein [Saccharospirillaceae bacterium]|nr:YajQ family cyclic di-GMP-binding protein [Pseudomonadales bacterium]NRB81172.1 YajQ family cyclic di-GMP-binding protein [Saccharospirillaceae bacterium]
MPSFDIVSELDKHELTNAIDQASRIIANRFDFKGSNASFDLTDGQVILKAESEFQIEQMQDMLMDAFIKRKLDVKSLDYQDMKPSGQEVKQIALVKEGIDSDNARKVVKSIKASKIKVQAAVQGEQVRVTGKKRDDLQKVMQLIRAEEFDMPMQFNNFRD